MEEERFPYAVAKQKADELISILDFFCEKIKLAGSIRRVVPMVKDIELVCIPDSITIDNLFEEDKERDPLFIRTVRALGKIEKGDPMGRYCKFIHEGIPVDLFMTTEADFIRQWVIRTGSAKFSMDAIAKRWVRIGWVGTSEGLRIRSECRHDGTKWNCIVKNPQLPPVWKTEQEFFTWLGVLWRPPQERTW